MTAQIIQLHTKPLSLPSNRVIQRPQFMHDSFFECLQERIKCTENRIDRLQDQGDYIAADLELSYADGLKRALKLYQEWCL